MWRSHASRLLLRLAARQANFVQEPGGLRAAATTSASSSSSSSSSSSARSPWTSQSLGTAGGDLQPKPRSNLASLLESLGPSPPSPTRSGGGGGGGGDPSSSPSPLTVQEEEWDVVRFFPAGIAPPAATSVSAAQLGLAPRDASLLRPPQHGVFSPLAASAAAAAMNGGGGGSGAAAAGIGVELGGRAAAAAAAGGDGGGGKAAAARASAAAAGLGGALPSASSASSVLAAPVATTQRATLAPRDTMAVPTVPAFAAGGEGGGGGGTGRREAAARGDGGSPAKRPLDVGGTGDNPARSRRLILLRTEAVRAAIGADEAWVFPCRRDADTRSALAAVRAAAEASPAPPRAWYERRGLEPPRPAPPLSPSSPSPLLSSARTDRRTTALAFPPGRTPRASFFSEEDDATNVVAASCSPSPPPLPFELAVLEALLSETVRQFERRHRQLRLLATGVEDDIGRTLRKAGGAGDVASSSELQRLLPIARALTAMAHDVREARAAVAEVADSDRLLAAVCLSDEVESSGEEKGGGGVEEERRRLSPSSSSSSSSSSLAATSEHARAAAALFESYERQLQSVEGALRELEEGLESARSVWNMT